MPELILPRKYHDVSGKYPQHQGKPKLSYSQYNSWKDPKYKAQYRRGYFAQIQSESGVYAEFGSETGNWKEWIGNGRILDQPENYLLSKEDEQWLATLPYPENSVYEDLIVVDCGDFVVEGYIDRCTYFEDIKAVEVVDFKTGSIKSKKAYYESPEYNQTTLYSYQKVQEGYDIIASEVMLLDRAGNNTPKHPLRLTHKVEIIPTPYSQERAEALLEDMAKVAKEISDEYQTYLKLFVE